MSDLDIDRLNLLLKQENLGIPDFRKVVDKSGTNVNWLRKVLRKKECSDELKRLLNIKQIEAKSE